MAKAQCARTLQKFKKYINDLNKITVVLNVNLIAFNELRQQQFSSRYFDIIENIYINL